MYLLSREQKVLIWSNFIETLHLIKNHFNNVGQRAELIYGKTPVRKDDSILINEEKLEKI